MLTVTLETCMDTELEMPSPCNMLMLEYPKRSFYNIKLTLGRETINLIRNTIEFIKETGADGVYVRLYGPRDKVVLVENDEEVDPTNFGIYFYYDPEFGEVDAQLVMANNITDEPYPSHKLFNREEYLEEKETGRFSLNLSDIMQAIQAFLRASEV